VFEFSENSSSTSVVVKRLFALGDFNSSPRNNKSRSMETDMHVVLVNSREIEDCCYLKAPSGVLQPLMVTKALTVRPSGDSLYFTLGCCQKMSRDVRRGTGETRHTKIFLSSAWYPCWSV
jgi:uncharacterized ParB-like nuclease family protein